MYSEEIEIEKLDGHETKYGIRSTSINDAAQGVSTIKNQN